MIIRRACAFWGPLVFSLGCAKSPSPTVDAPVITAPASAPLLLGALSAPASSVTLSDLASHAADYRGKTISTDGVVTAVCQEMGCWMEMKDEHGFAHIRMHGHSFFVPKTASGHHARVQATIVRADDETECDEKSGDAGKAMTRVELDATGIELD